MEFEQLITLINTVSNSKITEMEFEQNGAKVVLKKSGAVSCDNIVTMNVGTSEQSQQDTQENVQGKYIKSPLVGRFYVAPAEDAEPFVQVGDQVKKGQIVAIVEAMKLMNDIESDFDGVIEEVLVENGEPVEYGQPLFRVR